MARNLAAAPLVTAALVWVPWTLWAVLRAYAFGEPDPKLGREGGIAFAAALTGAMAVVAAITIVCVHAAWEALRGALEWRPFWSATVGSAIVLMVLAHYLSLIPPIGSDVFGEVGALVVIWVLVCIVVQLSAVILASSTAI